jgi:hypothetical protein
MSKFQDISGQRFGYLVVKEYAGGTRWKCICDCGRETSPLGGGLRHGRTTSCGCRRVEAGRQVGALHLRHGHCSGGVSSPIYERWRGMFKRCYNSNHKYFHRYGGRGIRVCERWFIFEYFLADMGEAPFGLTLDRIDNNGNYELGNCRWATKSEQRLNQ